MATRIVLVQDAVVRAAVRVVAARALQHALHAEAHVSGRRSIAVLASEGGVDACVRSSVDRYPFDLVPGRDADAVLLDEATAVQLLGGDAIGVGGTLKDAVHDVSRNDAAV